MNAIRTKITGGDPVNCFSEKEGSVYESFFCQHHPYNKNIEHQNKDYPERHKSAILVCDFEKYNLFSKLLNRKKEEMSPSVTFISRRELFLPDIVNVLTDNSFYNSV